MKKVVIATDQPVLARGFEDALLAGGFRVTAVAGDIGALFDLLQRDRPDAAIVDAHILPSISALADLCRQEPRCMLLLRAVHATQELRQEAARLGARAVLPHDAGAEQLTQTLGMLSSFLAPTGDGQDILEACDANERNLVSLVSQGMSTEEIAVAMKLPETHIKALLTSLLNRLNLADRYELALHGLASRHARPGQQGESILWKKEIAIV